MTFPNISCDFKSATCDGFQAVNAFTALKIKAEETQDFNHAMADIEGSNRHARNNTGKSQEAERKRRERITEQLTALAQKLRDDPAYAALYYATEDLLTRAETLTERALSKAHKDLTNAEETMRKVMNNAAKIPDGRHVFKDDDGSVWDAQDNRISDEDAAGIVWHKGGSTRGDLKAASNVINDSRDTVDRLTHYQVDVLGDARDKYSDKSVVMSKDEIQNIQDTINEAAEPEIKRELMPQVEAPAVSGDNFEPVKPQM